MISSMMSSGSDIDERCRSHYLECTHCLHHSRTQDTRLEILTYRRYLIGKDTYANIQIKIKRNEARRGYQMPEWFIGKFFYIEKMFIRQRASKKTIADWFYKHIKCLQQREFYH